MFDDLTVQAWDIGLFTIPAQTQDRPKKDKALKFHQLQLLTFADERQSQRHHQLRCTVYVLCSALAFQN
jgi:hypothetical protein